MPVPYAGDRERRCASSRSSRRSTAGRPSASTTGGPVIALLRDGASVTLEPGGQLELSGAHGRDDPRGLRRAARAHARDRRRSRARWASAGWASASTRSRAREDYAWVPKQRYGVMREYLPTRGGHALDMMLRTCTVQVNLDYESEADAMRKMRVALALSPATTAMFANSPWKEGKPARRPHLPRARVARRRSRSHGPPARAVEDGTRASTTTSSGRSTCRCSSSSATGTPIANTGQTFRSLLAGRLRGPPAEHGRLEDAPQHALPRGAPQEDDRDPRRRRAGERHEVRAARPLDGAPLRRAGARRGRGAGRRLDVRRGRGAAHARLEGRPPRRASAARRWPRWPSAWSTMAEGGLERRETCDTATGKDERVHLARLRKLVEQRRRRRPTCSSTASTKSRISAAAIVERSALRVGVGPGSRRSAASSGTHRAAPPFFAPTPRLTRDGHQPSPAGAGKGDV